MAGSRTSDRDTEIRSARGRLRDTRTTIRRGNTVLSATLTIPRGKIRAGIVPLHPADDGSKDQFLFEHLRRVASDNGVAVLRYDRRAPRAGRSPRMATQASDALAAIQRIRRLLKAPTLPVGLWGWSQGAWVASIAASRSSEVTFLVLLACTGVTPADQMRYGTAEHLRRAGYRREALTELLRLREAWENSVRGTCTVAEAQELVDRLAARPWFDLAWVPRRIPGRPRWPDMDFDPRPGFRRIQVPVLLFFGQTDEWSPIPASLRAWRDAVRVSGNRRVTILRLRGTGHAPTLGAKHSLVAISPEYTRRLSRWLADR